MMYMMTPKQHAQIANALDVFSTAYLCLATHHVKKDQHDGDDACPVRQRHVETLAMLKAMQPVKATAWYELNADMNAWFLAYGHNPRATTRALYTPTKD